MNLFSSHLHFAHHVWKQQLLPGDVIIDATCGNGKDALFLSTCRPSLLYCIDIQESAIQATKKLLENVTCSVHFLQQSHETLPRVAAKLIVYNLGYLPGGNKALTTLSETTIKSLASAMDILASGGMISITCYPGHEEGERESIAVSQHLESLNPAEWTVVKHSWVLKRKAPFLYLVCK